MKKSDYLAIREKFLACLPPLVSIRQNRIKHISIHLNNPDDLEHSTHVLFIVNYNLEDVHGREIDRNAVAKILHDHMIASGVNPATECEKTDTYEDAHLNGGNIRYTVRFED